MTLEIDFENALVWFDCPRCRGSGIDPIRVGIGDEHPCDPDDCRECGGMRATVVEMRTWASNLAVVGALCAAFRAGDNFGFHMGSDESQCTCQWSPNTHGEAYRGATRCEQEQLDDPEDWNTDCRHCEGYGCSSCDPLVVTE